MTLDELITQTRTQAPSLQPLELLASASRRQQELADLGDQLLDHFVQEARTAGCSWSQIGAALGVSKQAAQQRHSAVRVLPTRLTSGAESQSGAVFRRFTPRVRRAIVLAQEEAQQLCHQYVGTEHLLLGLLAEGEGIAAQALQRAGMTLDSARAEVAEITDRGVKAPSRHIPFTLGAKKVLELAWGEALELGHRYLGTQHLLLGLLKEDKGTGVQVVLAAGVQPDQLRETVLLLLAEASSGTG